MAENEPRPIHNVLLVEDQDNWQHVLSTMLNVQGHQITIVDSWRAAEEFLQKPNEITYVICDGLKGGFIFVKRAVDALNIVYERQPPVLFKVVTGSPEIVKRCQLENIPVLQKGNSFTTAQLLAQE